MELIELVRKDRLKSMERFWLGLLSFYFRIEIEGLENIPKKGAALITPNHSGFAGADAVLLTFVLKRETKRRARILAHRAFFDFSETLKSISESHGMAKATVAGGADMLAKGHLVILFPEGETGNFKPTYRRYQLQRFHTGFLRMAITEKAPVIPCVVLGAEESHLNFGNINFERIVKGLRIPLPLNFIPLPAKWRIAFLPPIDLSHITLGVEGVDDTYTLRREALMIQRKMQREIRRRLKKREYIYFREGRKFLNNVEGMIAKGIRAIKERQ